MSEKKNPHREWHAAKVQFAIQFGDRFVLTVRTIRDGLTHEKFYRTCSASGLSFVTSLSSPWALQLTQKGLRHSTGRFTQSHEWH